MIKTKKYAAFLLLAGCLFLSGCGAVSVNVPNQGATLDLSGQNMAKVPESIFSQTNLEELNLSQNKLGGSLPAEIRHLQKLKSLNISNNKMTGLPAEIGQLQSLEVLDISNNQLTGLPYELGNLKNLKTLNISGNAYSEADLKIIKAALPAQTVIIK